jgi:hypothetical protein
MGQKADQYRNGCILVPFLLLALLLGCSRTPSGTYEQLEATLTLIAKQDSVALLYPVWAPSGLIYFVAYPENGDSTELRELNPTTGAERVVAAGIGGPIAVAADGKIAALETSYRIIVYDSLGMEVWATNVGSTISSIAFSANSDELYYCKNGTVLLISIGSPSPHDTILKEITAFSKSFNDSIFIYVSISSANGDSLHTFYKYDAVTGEQSIILQEGFSAGLALNPTSADELAVGVVAASSGQLLAEQILLYHIDHGIGRIFESSPYDESYLHVASWTADGTALLITVTPYLAGDPITPLAQEIWMAEDIY